MGKSTENQDDFEFHAPACGATGSRSVYEAYLESKAALARVPKSHRGDSSSSIQSLLREKLLAQQTGGKLFRKNATADESLSQVWLARVSEAAYFMEAWRRPPKYKQINREFLIDFARLSANPENVKLVEPKLAELGIVVVHERSIPGMKVDGASFLLNSGRPVIALSLRYPRLDIYWFVLLHELAHVLIHYEKLVEPILDNFDEALESDIEVEANLASANALIPRNVWRSANIRFNSSEKELHLLADKAGTHAAVVAGRFQRETGRHYIFSELVNSVNVRDLIFGHE